MRLTAPAKINLHLEVLGRRSDGFHALETVFQTLVLGDDLTVELHKIKDDGAAEAPEARAISLTCSDPTIPADATNLAWRAAAAILEERPAAGRVAITLMKHIPHGAGLGGGSSDAASVLLALNAQLADPLTPADLAKIALSLGSDVPFFLLGGTAHATGRGEELTPLPEVPATPITVFMPNAYLPTPSVFKELTDAERGPRTPRGAPWAARQKAANLLHNRLTPAASRLCPPLGELLAWLATCGVPHLMSGSGAACFALAHLDPPAGVRAWHTMTGPGAILR